MYCFINGVNGDIFLYNVGLFDCIGSFWVFYLEVEDNCLESWVLISEVVIYLVEGELVVVLVEVLDNGDF